MKELRPSPSKAFESQLKALLMAQLAEKEAAGAARQNWLHRIVAPQYGLAGSRGAPAAFYYRQPFVYSSGVLNGTVIKPPFTVAVQAVTDRIPTAPGETSQNHKPEVTLKNDYFQASAKSTNSRPF